MGQATPEHRRCQREGCNKRKRDGYDYCTTLCRMLDSELSNTEELCRLVGPGSMSSDLWLSAVALNDALTAYLIAGGKVRGALGRSGGLRGTPRGVTPTGGQKIAT